MRVGRGKRRPYGVLVDARFVVRIDL